jgi:hypothetical protein
MCAGAGQSGLTLTAGDKRAGRLPAVAAASWQGLAVDGWVAAPWQLQAGRASPLLAGMQPPCQSRGGDASFMVILQGWAQATLEKQANCRQQQRREPRS